MGGADVILFTYYGCPLFFRNTVNLRRALPAKVSNKKGIKPCL